MALGHADRVCADRLRRRADAFARHLRLADRRPEHHQRRRQLSADGRPVLHAGRRDHEPTAASPSASSMSRSPLVGHIPGGLGYVTILASCVLASLSGSAAADAAALAALLVPMMVAAGHSKMYAAGLVAAGGIIAPGHSAEHRLRAVRRRRRRLDLQAVPGRHLPRPDARRRAVLSPGGGSRAARTSRSPPRKSLREIVLGRRRRLLGPDAARHHHRRPAVRHLHADRGRRRRRGLLAVRRDLRLPRTEAQRSSTRSSSRPR